MIRLSTKHLTIKLIFSLLFPQLLLKELRKEWSSLNGQSASSTRGKTRFPTPSVWTLIAEAVISVVMLKYGNHRSWQWRGWKQKKKHNTERHVSCDFARNVLYAHDASCWCLKRSSPYLYLFVLEDWANAGVEGGSRKHGGNWVCQIQDLLKVWSHTLKKKVLKKGSEEKHTMVDKEQFSFSLGSKEIWKWN